VENHDLSNYQWSSIVIEIGTPGENMTVEEPLRDFSTQKRKSIQKLTGSFLAYFDDFTSKITTNDRSRLGKAKVNMFPVCRILRNMSHFDQNILGPIFRQLDKYEKKHYFFIQQKILWLTLNSSRTNFLLSRTTSASGMMFVFL
jgi:hypothetical protein